MAQATVPVSKNSTPAQGPQAPVVVPPEEQFWKRYSPHHEFPLSAVTSFVLHAIIITILACGAWLLLKLGLNDHSEPLPLDTIVVAGGGGNPQGEGNGPGNGVVGAKHEEAVPTDNKSTTPTGPATDVKPNIKVAEADPLTLPELSDTGGRVLPETVANLSDISKEARKEIFRGLAGPPAGKGQGGTGSGGGKGAGHGTGEGDLEGPGKSRLNIRQQRVLRWVMNFNTRSGEDYAQQLIGLGAILAIPAPEGGYRVVRDLTRRPVTGDKEDLATIKRIFWVDNKPQSVASLSQALGIHPIPPHIVAFFPESLEKQLLEKELAYRGRSEGEIKETLFRVQRRGGTYEAVVEDQKLK